MGWLHGGSLRSYSQSEFDAIKQLSDAGHIFVCSAGNDSCHLGESSNCQFYSPAMYDIENVITVGATTIKGLLADFSNFGTEVNILAPGENTPGLGDVTLPDMIKFASGTSFSSPIVSAALAFSIALRPAISNADRFRAMYYAASTSKVLPGGYSSNGNLNTLGLLRNTVTPDSYAGVKLTSSAFQRSVAAVLVFLVALLL